MASLRKTVLEILSERLTAIVAGESNGHGETFETNAGQVEPFLGEVLVLGKDDPDFALAIVVGDDASAVGQLEKVRSRLTIEIQAIARVSAADAWMAIESMLADIKRAIETPARDLGLPNQVLRQIERGPSRTLPREEGSNVVGVGITYVIPIAEVWGHP